MNTRVIKTIAVAAFAAVAVPTLSSAAVPTTSVTQTVPGTMNYQGYLADPSTGNPYVDGIYTLDIRIWNASSGGTCLWGGKYSVYVKDGYFNIMLGDSSAAALTSSDGTVPTYGNTELWKAMWGSTATDVTRYLGVTPRQNASHATISSPSEISPRQQLLSSPFAFRAERAQYADGSQTDFKVPGNLTVSGTTTFTGGTTFNGAITATSAGTQKFGKIQTTSTSVNLGNGYTSANSSNRTSLPTYVYDVGQYLYFYSYYSMNFAPTAGSVNFTIPSGYNMKVTGSGSFVSDAKVNTIGGTGATTITGSAVTVGQQGSGSVYVKGSSVTVQASGNANINGAGVTLHATNGFARVYSDTGCVYLDPKTSSFVAGQGKLRWATGTSSSSSSSPMPFQLKKVTVSLTMGTAAVNSRRVYSGSMALADTENYVWTVAGFSITSTRVVANEVEVSGSNLRVYAEGPAETSEVGCHVQLMGINKNWVDDQR